MKTVRNMLTAAATLGYSFKVGTTTDVYYSGASVNKAIDELEEIDEGYITVVNERGYRCGSAYFMQDMPDDEQMQETGGWVNDWIDENM